MNWDAIGAAGEIVAAVTALATLIYLARQIHQANSIAVASPEISLRESANEICRRITDRSEYAALIAKLAANSTGLNAGEKQQAIARVGLNINLWSVTRAHEQGFITKYTLNNHFTDVEATLDMYPGSMKYFKAQTEHYNFVPGTSPLIDKLIEALKERGY